MHSQPRGTTAVQSSPFHRQQPMQRTVKDSVFTDLFSRPRYAYELYRSLHPQDRTSTESDVRIVTIQNSLTANAHNDLGILVGSKLLILAEAQSTWSPNIALRALLYASQTIKDLIHERKLDVYSSKPVALPRPELYMIYTGSRASPKTVSLSQAHYEGVVADIESRVHVIDEAGPTLPGQYIDFARTIDACRKELGPTEEAVRTAIKDCTSRGVLTEYLLAHETEAVSIMMTLFDEEEIHRNWLASERRDAAVEATAKTLVETCKDFGQSQEQTAARLAAKLPCTPSAAAEHMKRYWEPAAQPA